MDDDRTGNRGILGTLRIDVPSSARIENDLTEIWITVGLVGFVDVGRLFATPQSVGHKLYADTLTIIWTYMKEWCRLVIYVRHVESGDMTVMVVEPVLSNLTLVSA